MKKIEYLIKKINEFSVLICKRKLTNEEQKQRDEIRNEYRSLFKEGFEQRLKNIKFINEKEKDN